MSICQLEIDLPVSAAYWRAALVGARNGTRSCRADVISSTQEDANLAAVDKHLQAHRHFCERSGVFCRKYCSTCLWQGLRRHHLRHVY